jgi:hypothetical protein
MQFFIVVVAPAAAAAHRHNLCVTALEQEKNGLDVCRYSLVILILLCAPFRRSILLLLVVATNGCRVALNEFNFAQLWNQISLLHFNAFFFTKSACSFPIALLDFSLQIA